MGKIVFVLLYLVYESAQGGSGATTLKHVDVIYCAAWCPMRSAAMRQCDAQACVDASDFLRRHQHQHHILQCGIKQLNV